VKRGRWGGGGEEVKMEVKKHITEIVRVNMKVTKMKYERNLSDAFTTM